VRHAGRQSGGEEFGGLAENKGERSDKKAQQKLERRIEGATRQARNR
jgi:hypothetical protein